MPKRFFFGLIACLTASTLGCAGTAPDQARPFTEPVQQCCWPAEISERQTAIARTAAGLVGARTITVNGRRIAYDCAGVARAIYLRHGIDLYENQVNGGQANGVRMIYTHVRQHGRIHRGPIVQPGDLVFFDNTWDANGDGKLNDPLTHIGIVELVERDGTVVFISRVASAIERYRLNLEMPDLHRAADGRIVNDYLRRKDSRDADGTQYLTGELFSAFGTRVSR